MTEKKIEGIGLGLRFPHFDEILSSSSSTPWFEVLTDDFLEVGPHFVKLKRLREKYPIVFHSVGLNVGGVDPLNPDLVHRFKSLYDEFKPEYISDHLCWSAHNGKYHHDLLPIPKTKEALENLVARVHYLQEYFGRPLVLENITSYVQFKKEDYSDSEFIELLVKKTGCGLLLDITNVYINAFNQNFDPLQWMDKLPLDSVKYMHLAGGVQDGDLIIDSHSEKVPEEHLEGLKFLANKGYEIPVAIERDTNLPSFSVLESERLSVEKYVEKAPGLNLEGDFR